MANGGQELYNPFKPWWLTGLPKDAYQLGKAGLGHYARGYLGAKGADLTPQPRWNKPAPEGGKYVEPPSQTSLEEQYLPMVAKGRGKAGPTRLVGVSGMTPEERADIKQQASDIVEQQVEAGAERVGQAARLARRKRKVEKQLIEQLDPMLRQERSELELAKDRQAIASYKYNEARKHHEKLSQGLLTWEQTKEKMPTTTRVLSGIHGALRGFLEGFTMGRVKKGVSLLDKAIARDMRDQRTALEQAASRLALTDRDDEKLKKSIDKRMNRYKVLMYNRAQAEARMLGFDEQFMKEFEKHAQQEIGLRQWKAGVEAKIAPKVSVQGRVQGQMKTLGLSEEAVFGSKAKDAFGRPLKKGRQAMTGLVNPKSAKNYAKLKDDPDWGKTAWEFALGLTKAKKAKAPKMRNYEGPIVQPIKTKGGFKKIIGKPGWVRLLGNKHKVGSTYGTIGDLVRGQKGFDKEKEALAGAASMMSYRMDVLKKMANQVNNPGWWSAIDAAKGYVPYLEQNFGKIFAGAMGVMAATKEQGSRPTDRDAKVFEKIEVRTGMGWKQVRDTINARLAAAKKNFAQRIANYPPSHNDPRAYLEYQRQLDMFETFWSKIDKGWSARMKGRTL